jgi:hypothetical protein
VNLPSTSSKARSARTCGAAAPERAERIQPAAG